MAEVTLPSPQGAHPGSSRGLHLGSFTIHERRTVDMIHNACAPIRFPDEAGTPARFILHERRAEKSNLTAHGRALISSEAQDPAWFALPGTAPGARTQIRGV